MSILSDIFASSGLGAIVGLLGSWLTKREERRNIEIKLAHDAKMADIRKEEAAIESTHELAMAEKHMERVEVEGGISLGMAEMSAFTQGLKEQQMLYKIRWVDAIRGLMRPVITIYLLILASFVTWRVGIHTGGLAQLDQATMSNLYADTIGQIFFLVTTAVTWWFGSRPGGTKAW